MKKNYEEAIRRLEEIDRTLADANLDIEQITALVKEAKTLAAYCKQRLYKLEEAIDQELEHGEEKDADK